MPSCNCDILLQILNNILHLRFIGIRRILDLSMFQLYCKPQCSRLLCHRRKEDTISTCNIS
jgi:hypothetical protein